MASQSLESQMRSMGLRICGDCAHLKGSDCAGFKIAFPTMRTDPCCSEWTPKKK